MMIDQFQAPAPKIVKDNQTRLFMQFILIYLLILLSGWLNHLSQPIISDLDPGSTAMHTSPYEVGHLP